MKKLLLLLIPILMLTGTGGALWWKYGRGKDSVTRAQELMDKGDLRGAALELRTTLRNDPNNAAAHFRMGQVAQRTGDNVAAEKEFKLAREKGFEARLINPLLAQTYMSQGRYRELLRDFNTQGLPADQAAPLMTMRAMAQLSLGDSKAALATANDAERQSPQSVEAALASARVLVTTRDFPGAEAKIERALQLNPRAQDALIMKGQLLNVKGDRVRATEIFDQVIAFNPQNLTARLERANLLIMDSKDTRAREDVEAAIKLEPRSSMALYLRAVLFVKAENYAAADADLSKIANFIGRFPRGLFFYAITKYNIGQAEQASDAANKYLAKNTNEPDAIKLYARIELASRRTAGVINLLTKSQQAGIADADMLDLLARAYLMAGKADVALANLERASSLAPQNAEILTRLAALRLSMGDAGRAAGEFERVLDIAPEQSSAAEQLVLAAIASGEIDRATLGLARLRKIQGESETVGNLAALIRMAQLDLTGALELLQKTIKAFPDAIQPRINMARVLTLQDRVLEAQVLLNEVLDRRPAEPGALVNLVGLLVADGKPGPALERLEAAHAAAPKDAEITIALANHQIRMNEPRKALGLVDEVLKVQDGNLALLAAKARLHMSLGQIEDAEAAWRLVIDANPLDTDARRAIADLRLDSKDTQGAINTLNDGLRADPGNNDLMQALLKVALKTGGLEAGLAMADKLTLNPANMPNARWLRGDALMAAGRFTEAVPAYTADYRAEPTTQSLVRLVTAYNAAGRADQSTAVLRDWLGRNPRDAVAAEQLASLDLIARRFFEAEKQLNIILAQRPSDSTALNNLAWVYLQRADPRARTVAQKSYLLKATPEAADTLGWILVTTGEPATALTLLRQAASQLRNDPTVTYHLAVAYKEVGRKEDAIAALRTIVQSLAEFDDRPAAQALLAQLTAK
jgi:putative PEP-CTERM system TPR-repeat lipoprotein